MKTKRERFEERIESLRELHGCNWRNVCHLDMGGDAPPPPDYTPVAESSAEAARLSAELGREQLAENKRQFEVNMGVAQPIIAAQTKLMGQAYDQGTQNFEAFKTEGRPLQQSMRDEAMGVTSTTKQRLMDEAAATAIADARTGTTQQMNQLMRQGARYGWSPAKLATMGTSAATAGATGTVAAANAARTQAGDKYYAKLGDVYNTYAGLGSSAPTFYQTGTQAGSSAVSNQNQTAAQYLQGMSVGNQTIMQGQGLKVQGLGGVLNSQTSYANANQGDSMGSLLGGMGGAALGAAKLYTAFSDRRLKENISLVGRDDRTGLNLYEFTYINGDGSRYVGVMADEVESLFPSAVAYDEMGFASVNYGMLGIEFKEVA